MRRPARFFLITLLVLLVIAGGYTAYWFIVAGRIEAGIAAWAQSVRKDKIETSWQKIHVAGFPSAFRVELETMVLRDNAVTPSPEFRVSTLSGIARPWNFTDWRLIASDGFTAEMAGPGEQAPAKLNVRTADGVVTIEPNGGWQLRLHLQDAIVDAPERVHVESADARIAVPPNMPRDHHERELGIAVDARQVNLPGALTPLGPTLDELDFSATVKGELPNGRLADAVAAWRDAGGMIGIDHLHLEWGALSATANGTVSLDDALQPIADLSGAIQGYDAILAALVRNGQMRATDAGLARMALTFLAKTGPDGKPEIRAEFTIRDGQMFLGPAKLGKAPRLNLK